MGKLNTLLTLSVLAFAGTAAAANAATVSISLSPDKVSKHSSLTVSASNFPANSGLPTSVEFKVQRGFTTSAKSVSVLCANSGSCPAASKIGSGTASVTGTVLGQAIPDTVTFTLFLGVPKQAGDVASVDITGSDTVLHQTISGSGRLFRSGGGLDLLFDHFPTVSPPAGATVTVNSLTLSASASRTVKVRKTVGKGKHRHKVKRKVTYALITNPSSCTGMWTGSATVTFASGPVSRPLSTPCTS